MGLRPKTLPEPSSPRAIASEWLQLFISDIESSILHGILSLERSFVDDSYWRDLLAFTPDYRTLYPKDLIQQTLSNGVVVARPTAFKIVSDARTRRAGHDQTFVQGVVKFQTTMAECSGVFTLLQTDGGIWKAWSFVSVLDHLHGVAERYKNGTSSPHRPFERGDVMEYGAVVLGAGQCGLGVAASLENLGVPTLVVEKAAAVGNTWRHRYKALETNTTKAFNSLPFLPYPEHLQEYVPCTDVADYLEGYHKTLGLHILTSATATPSYDTVAQKWKIVITQSDQPTITVVSNHLIVATGVGTLKSDVPFLPSIPGKASFRGVCMHSSEYSYACIAEGQNAVVVGAGCSGHDIAQDLTTGGSKVTFVQRSSTAIVSRETMRRLVGGYFEPEVLPIDIADRWYISLPFKAVKSFPSEVTSRGADLDKDLRESLAKCGYLLPPPDDVFLDRLSTRRGGYYIDRGCGELIVSGKITVKAGVEISYISPSGLVFADGTRVNADLIVFATGYKSTTVKEVAEKLLGPEVAESVNDVGAWSKDWELAGIWKPSGHQGLWFAEGDLFYARFYAQRLALQIKAREMGLLTPGGDGYVVPADVAQTL